MVWNQPAAHGCAVCLWLQATRHICLTVTGCLADTYRTCRRRIRQGSARCFPDESPTDCVSARMADSNHVATSERELLLASFVFSCIRSHDCSGHEPRCVGVLLTARRDMATGLNQSGYARDLCNSQHPAISPVDPGRESGSSPNTPYSSRPSFVSNRHV